jgi:hypothetical protein
LGWKLDRCRSKTDRNDARGIAQMMRVALYRPVHVKTLRSQKLRMLLTHRKLLQSKAIAIENDLRATLRNFGLKVGMIACQCLPMTKSRGRKPKKKRAPASAPKKRLDNFNTTPQELSLSTQPPQEPPLATAPRQEQPTPKIKKIAKLTTAVVLAAIAIAMCAYAFILTKH